MYDMVFNKTLKIFLSLKIIQIGVIVHQLEHLLCTGMTQVQFPFSHPNPIRNDT